MLKHTLIAILTLLAVPFASAASFNCTKAASAIEKTICADPELSKLDETLNAAYLKAVSRVGDKALVRQWQRNWLKSPAVYGCRKSDCLKPVFAQRIADLDAATGSPWSGRFVRYTNGVIDRNSSEILLVANKDGSVFGEASAVWIGPHMNEGQVHVGDLNAIGSFTGENLIFETEECHVNITRRGKGLEVEDSGNCGGLNVTFTGDYRRSQDRQASGASAQLRSRN